MNEVSNIQGRIADQQALVSTLQRKCHGQRHVSQADWDAMKKAEANLKAMYAELGQALCA